MADREGQQLTEVEHETLKRLIDAGLNDPQRIQILVDLVNSAQAWGVVRRFIIQLAVGTGALSALGAALLWIREWWNK